MAVILNSQQEVLIAKRSLKKSYGRLWELPGEKLQEADTPQVTAKREPFEEHAITAQHSAWRKRPPD